MIVQLLLILTVLARSTITQIRGKKMVDVVCTECGWHGHSDDTFTDCFEDSHGDLVGEHLLACPECYAPTVDDDFDPEDLGDSSDS